MPAYVLVRSAITDPEQYRLYAQASTPITTRYGGRFLARGGAVETLEGPAESRRLVIIEFPSMERALEWHRSAEYQAARALRLPAATAEFVAVEGV